MARGPFQGTYQAGVRPTVVTAPDALVYVNGEVDILGCPQCRRRFDWNKYITSIQVDLNIDSPPGSASINLSVPRHSVDDFYFEGQPLITSMMEIEIYAKGYYLLEGVPQYYPIFWGLVTEVTEAYSGGEHTFSINCSDILKWWELCKMNVNPAFTAAAGQQGRSNFGNVFHGMNPYDVIWSLAHASFGDIVIGTGSLNTIQNERNPALASTFKNAMGDLMQYWNRRFSKIRSNLLLYGTTGTAVRGDQLQAAYENLKPGVNKPFASQLVRQANGGNTQQMDFDPTDPNVVAFRVQGTQAGQTSLWQTEFQTKLEIANSSKQAIGFEFYMDVTGDIVFKPPFFNLDVLSNKPVSWIQDIDIIDFNIADSEAEVVTQLQVQGNYTGNIDWGIGEEATPYTSVTDYHLLRRYGWRVQNYNSEFLADPRAMFYVGLDVLDQHNAKRFKATCNIPLRPELRLGFPIYLAPKDQFWYVTGISHNISFGGRAQTTLNLTSRRGKFMAPKGIGTIELTGTTANPQTLTPRQLAEKGHFKVNVGEAAQIPPTNAPSQAGDSDPYEPLVLRHPKTGRIVGYPNVVMAYTGPFTATADQLATLKGEKKPTSQKTDGRTAQSRIKEAQDAALEQIAQISEASFTVQEQDRVREKHMTNRYSYGLNSAGVYTYLHDKSQVIREMIVLPANRVSFNNSQIQFTGKSGMIRPVSDDRGYEVIGHHRYGRNVLLRDGALVLNDGNPNERTNPGLQLALSGGLLETLQAQSQGLTTVSTPYVNAADAITKLQPEDLQTAATIVPELNEPRIIEGETTFVKTAPLNSPERIGATTPANVEATQLSRALTLAEMTVREGLAAGGTIDPNCLCVSGRADLAFISVGYQVKTLRPTTSDVNLSEQARAIIEQAQSAEIPAEAIAQAIEQYRSTDPDLSQAIAAQGLSGIIDDTSDDLNPKRGVRSHQDTIGVVEAFLANLYTALDVPHQEREKELRGEHIQLPARKPETIRFGETAPELSPFAPPYSTPNRALGGDPEALAIQARTSINQIPKAWSKFSTDLKANTARRTLEVQISQERARVQRLEQEKQDLERKLQSKGTTSGDIPKNVRDLQTEIDALQKDIDDKQTELRQLNLSSPPPPQDGPEEVTP